MIYTALAAIGIALAALPFGLVLVNLMLYRTPKQRDEPLPKVSVLIPARNEEPRIEQAVLAALSSQGVEVEVLVMDDHSTDRTAEIVETIASKDPRLKLHTAPPLPAGWAGKQHACQALADQATSPVLLFVDADVLLAKDSVARAASFLQQSGSDLASGFPRQITGSPVERLVIPLIHFVLLGYLPLIGMRLSNSEGFAAGCGQFFIARREAYEATGGHGAIRDSFHDGIKLPRAFRRAGFRTDLFDATSLASCRMYSNGREVVFGLAKNAHEGMAGPTAIWVWSFLLLGGQVLPFLLALGGLAFAAGSLGLKLSLLAVVLGIATRLMLALRFRQSWTSALLHPIGIAILIGIQWFSRHRRRTGRAVGWKDRAAVQ